MSGQLFDIRTVGNMIGKATAFRNFDPVLRRELSRRLRLAVEPLKEAIAESALENLPKSGGLAQIVADSKTGVRTTLVGNRTGVRLVTSNAHAIKSMDGGRLRHPVWPRPTQTRDQWHWVTQDVKPRWWSDPVEKAKPEIIASVDLVVKSVLEEIRTA